MTVAATAMATTKKKTKKKIERGRRKKMNSATNLPTDFLVDNYRRIFLFVITGRFIDGFFCQ